MTAEDVRELCNLTIAKLKAGGLEALWPSVVLEVLDWPVRPHPERLAAEREHHQGLLPYEKRWRPGCKRADHGHVCSDDECGPA